MHKSSIWKSEKLYWIISSICDNDERIGIKNYLFIKKSTINRCMSKFYKMIGSIVHFNEINFRASYLISVSSVSHYFIDDNVAIVDIASSGKYYLRARLHTPYPRAVKAAILAVSNTQTHTAEISRLNFLLGELYAEAFLACCKSAVVPVESVKLIGCHGQTIFHEGRPGKYLGRRVPNTLQIGEAAVLAGRTGIDVVSNFRERDIAAGGQGAPLVPLVDFLLFRHPKRGRVALNLGGIANITVIPAHATIGAVVAFESVKTGSARAPRHLARASRHRSSSRLECRAKRVRGARSECESGRIRTRRDSVRRS